jgi:ribosomal protein L37AE/L43A
MSDNDYKCWGCDVEVNHRRWDAGLRMCVTCGEAEADRVRKFWTVVPMPKSNYILVTDPSLLVGLNNSHKGGK